MVSATIERERCGAESSPLEPGIPALGDLAWLRTPAVIIAFLAALLLANLLAVAFVSREQTVYFWDYSGYWNMSRDLSDAMVHDPGHAFRRVLYTVANDDYNLLPAVPVSALMLLLGKSRLAYELAIVNTYLAATLLTFMLLVRRLSDPGADDRRILAVSLATLLLWSVVWGALLRGLPDLGGVVLINLIFLVYFQNPAAQLRWRALAGLGLLLASLVLFRRWYAFWALHFLFLMVVDGGVAQARRRRLDLRHVLMAVRPGLAAGSIALVVLLVLARPFLVRVATTNYADIYSSYRSSIGWTALLHATAQHLGYLYVLGFLVSAVVLAGLARTRRLVLFLGLQMSLIYLHFTRTQFFGIHHFYLFLPTMALLLALFWVKVLGRPRPLWSSLAFGAFALTSLGTLTCVLKRDPPRFLKNIEPLASVCKMAPLVRNDMGELFRMAVVLDDLTRKTKDSIYVLSSSYILNADHLANAGCSMPLAFDLRERLAQVMHIDKRDGFPNCLLTASYVVVADPVQLHLPEGQRVITCPTESLLHATDLGQAFERLPYEFHLDQGVRVWIYRKKRAIENGELVAFRERLRAAYPDRPFVWMPSGQ